MTVNGSDSWHLSNSDLLIPPQFLVESDLWVVMEYLESVLTDVVTEIAMSESHMATVSKEVLKAIAFLHDKGSVGFSAWFSLFSQKRVFTKECFL